MVSRFFLILTSFVYLSQLANASISLSFYNYMKKTRGYDFAESVARYDFGLFGSFGGGNHVGGTKTKNIPVIFVHGLWGTSAAYEPAKAMWVLAGYGPEELYGSSYGIPMVPFASVGSYQTSVACQYAKNIRNLIIGVSEYTNNSVNVIGYSMGGPVSRKAILGGKCVDTGEDLGPPLTHLVDTYLGVAGANKGAMLCIPPLWVCSFVNGMVCGSKFMNDINKVKRYEAHRKIYVMQTVSDEIVGYLALGCSGHPAEIDGADKTVTLIGFLHLGIIGLTGPLQYSLVSRDEVVVPKNQKYQIS
ncbi:Lipase domain containing protein [Aphelenchoides bicaudatus]|nr:Lipase domain containing protein [Aphelenchoides bicaudatus]